MKLAEQHVTTITRRGSGYGFRCSCGYEPNQSARQRKVAEKRARIHAKEASR